VEIRPNGAPLGAEIHGLDATQPISGELVLRLKRGLRDHHILIFKEQDTSIATSFATRTAGASATSCIGTTKPCSTRAVHSIRIRAA
jgi:alpha-ketoglutarate-dependent taurine dioxygenase